MKRAHHSIIGGPLATARNLARLRQTLKEITSGTSYWGWREEDAEAYRKMVREATSRFTLWLNLCTEVAA